MTCTPYTDTGLAELVDDTSGIGDKGYIGTNLITPKRKPPKATLSDHDKDFNKSVNTLRAVVSERSRVHQVWRVGHVTGTCRCLDHLPQRGPAQGERSTLRSASRGAAPVCPSSRW